MRYRSPLLAVMILAGFGSIALAVDSWDTPDSKWRTGPVKYLLTKEEDQEFKKLKTDDERKAYVEAFWVKRDPSPGTPDNEYRDLFYQRAREAASRYTEDNGKGWQDDRGKVYIFLGPPDETSQNSSLLDSGGSGSGSNAPSGTMTGGYGGTPTGAPGSEDSRPQTAQKAYRFIYRNNPLTGKPERLELNFRGEVTGGFRLEEKIDWNQVIARGLMPAKKSETAAAPPAGGAPAPSSGATPPPAGQTPPSVPPASAVPAPAEATPQSDLMQQVRAAAGAPASAIPLDVTVNFYKAAKGTLTTLTLEVKRSALPAGADPDALVIAAEVLDAASGESVQRFLKAEHFGGYEGNKDPAAGDVLLYQAERAINPGSYKAIFALKDPVSGAVGKLEKDLVVPDYESPELSLSSVTLARKLDPLVDAPPADKLTPFVLGNFKVVPRPDNIYKPGEEATFYYQIYNPTTDPTTHVPNVELQYSFEVSISGTWRMLGGKPLMFPGQTLLVQAYTLPLANRPPGDYRITIKAVDRLATPPKTATAQVMFKLLGAATPSKGKAKSKG